jgi:DHA1 family inner membrane transport protein
VIGNIVGGRLADRALAPAVLGTLVTLALVLGSMTFVLHNVVATVIWVGLLGAAAFATVAPLQLWVLERVDGAGRSLASSFNIAAFNLGNALGAWAGGLVIASGPGLAWLPLLAALFPCAAAALVVPALRRNVAQPNFVTRRA